MDGKAEKSKCLVNGQGEGVIRVRRTYAVSFIAAIIAAAAIASAYASTWTPNRQTLNERRHHVMSIREKSCLNTWKPKPVSEVVNLRFAWGWWGALKERTRAKGDHCGPVDIIRRVFPDATEDDAIRVASCESHLYTYAHNPSGASGLFQLMPFWWAGKFDPYDPWANTRAAYSISSAGYNWGAWVCQP